MAGLANATLRNQLVGSWELIEYCAYLPRDESDKIYPQGADATGIIMYSPDGYMSAQLQTQGQKPFVRMEGTEEEWAQAGKSYVAYTGRFFLDEGGDEKGRPILKHEMRDSNIPFLRGDVQRRIVKIEQRAGARYLVLSLDEPTQRYGEDRLIRVTWRRLQDNQAVSPPEGAGKL